jgi:hypothetical protein
MAKKNVSSSMAGTSTGRTWPTVRVDADGEPVGGDVEHALADVVGLVGPGGERVLVGDQEEAVVGVLEGQPVLDRPDVVPEVHLPSRGVAGQDAGLGGGRQSKRRREDVAVMGGGYKRNAGSIHGPAAYSDLRPHNGCGDTAGTDFHGSLPAELSRLMPGVR